MTEHITIENQFQWTPYDKRISRFGPLPYRKPESRKPALWLARSGNSLYFVNSSAETLDFVRVRSGGFLTADDEVLGVSSDEGYEYKNVKTNSAVKVEEYDGYYDLDYVLQVTIVVGSKHLGCVKIISPAHKGGVKETVLLWDNNESEKHVSIEKCT